MTEPRRPPTRLDRWSLPGVEGNTQPLLWSPHEITLEDGRAYTSNYHGGTRVLEVANDSLEPVGAHARPGPGDGYGPGSGEPGGRWTTPSPDPGTAPSRPWT